MEPINENTNIRRGKRPVFMTAGRRLELTRKVAGGKINYGDTEGAELHGEKGDGNYAAVGDRV